MHVMFVHQSFPAQFGHIARKLVRDLGWRCTAVARNAASRGGNVELIPYEHQGGATANNHYCTRTFDNAVAHCHGVYRACRQAVESCDFTAVLASQDLSSARPSSLRIRLRVLPTRTLPCLHCFLLASNS